MAQVEAATDASEDSSRRLIRDFKWYHWLVVILAAINGAFGGDAVGMGIVARGLGGALGAILFVAVLRIVWHEDRR